MGILLHITLYVSIFQVQCEVSTSDLFSRFNSSMGTAGIIPLVASKRHAIELMNTATRPRVEHNLCISLKLLSECFWYESCHGLVLVLVLVVVVVAVLVVVVVAVAKWWW